MIPEDLFAPLLEAVPDGILLADEAGLIRHVNRQLEEMSGYTRDELLGEEVEMLVPVQHRGAHVGHRGAYNSSEPVRRVMGTGLDIHLRRKDGTEFPADIALSPLRVAGAYYVVAAVRDITDRKRAQRRLEAMLAVTQAILGGDELDSVLTLIAASARDLVGSALAMISVPQPGDQYLTRVAVGDRADQLRGMRVPAAASIMGTILSGSRPLLIDDLSKDPRAYQPAVEAGNLGPAIYLPLAVRDRAFGTLVLCNLRGGPPFTDDDLQQVQLFSAQAAVALEYARLRGEVERLAVVEDRERIARELHDGAIQSLFAVGMSMQATALQAGDPAVQQRLEAEIGRIDEVIRDLRNYIFGLRPGMLADRQLDQALRKLVQDLESDTGITAVADIDGVLAARLAPRSADLIQLAREALSNIGRHANAMTCRLSLQVDDGRAVLEVEDDGEGFEAGRPAGAGQGLRNIRERAAQLGAEVSVSSELGEGTTVRVEIPL